MKFGAIFALHLLTVQLISFIGTWFIVIMRMLTGEGAGSVGTAVNFLATLISPLAWIQKVVHIDPLLESTPLFMAAQCTSSLVATLIIFAVMALSGRPVPVTASSATNGRRSLLAILVTLPLAVVILFQNHSTALAFSRVAQQLESSPRPTQYAATNSDNPPTPNTTRPSTISFHSQRGFNYLIERRSSPTAAFVIVGTVHGTGELLGFPLEAGWDPTLYRVVPIQKTEQRDSDGDGMSDDYENRYRPVLNPNDASDAVLDSDGDALSNLEEAQYEWDPTRTSSPTPVQLSRTPGGQELFSVVMDPFAESK